jgi:hypothetical protein
LYLFHVFSLFVNFVHSLIDIIDIPAATRKIVLLKLQFQVILAGQIWK